MPSTSHRAKRPYQPPITSFLGRPEFSEASPSDPHLPHLTTSPPAIPSTVQASLLNVGMRVRKSVPEGYKNKQHDPDAYDTYSVKPVAQAHPPSSSHHPRELLPFCGLLKIGGFAAQPTANSSSSGIDWPLDAYPPLFASTAPFSLHTSSSAASFSSTDSPPRRNPNPHKRSFDDADARDAPLPLFHPLEDEDEPVSPMSAYPYEAPLRPLAQPRTKGMRKWRGGDGNAQVGQMGGGGGGGKGDFEEAEFLRPVGDGGEVEMGGV